MYLYGYRLYYVFVFSTIIYHRYTILNFPYDICYSGQLLKLSMIQCLPLGSEQTVRIKYLIHTCDS